MDIQLMLNPQKPAENRGISVAALGFVIAEVLTIGHRCRILKFANKQKIPAMYEFGLFARDGGLLAYGPKLTDTFQRGAHYVAKILKGSKPQDLPVEQPMDIRLAVNVATAKDLGAHSDDRDRLFRGIAITDSD